MFLAAAGSCVIVVFLGSCCGRRSGGCGVSGRRLERRLLLRSSGCGRGRLLRRSLGRSLGRGSLGLGRRALARLRQRCRISAAPPRAAVRARAFFALASPSLPLPSPSPAALSFFGLRAREASDAAWRVACACLRHAPWFSDALRLCVLGLAVSALRRGRQLRRLGHRVLQKVQRRVRVHGSLAARRASVRASAWLGPRCCDARCGAARTGAPPSAACSCATWPPPPQPAPGWPRIAPWRALAHTLRQHAPNCATAAPAQRTERQRRVLRDLAHVLVALRRARGQRRRRQAREADAPASCA